MILTIEQQIAEEERKMRYHASQYQNRVDVPGDWKFHQSQAKAAAERRKALIELRKKNG